MPMSWELKALQPHTRAPVPAVGGFLVSFCKVQVPGAQAATHWNSLQGVRVTNNSDYQREDGFPPGSSGFTAGEEGKGAAPLCWDWVDSFGEQPAGSV